MAMYRQWRAATAEAQSDDGYELLLSQPFSVRVSEHETREAQPGDSIVIFDLELARRLIKDRAALPGRQRGAVIANKWEAVKS